MSPQRKTHSSRYDLGKGIKIQLPFVCRGGCRGEGKPWFNFTFEIFFSVNKVSLSHSKATVAPIFSFMLQWTPRNTAWSPEGHVVHSENRWFGWHSKHFSSGTVYLLSCLLFNVVYIGVSICYLINARTWSSYVFLRKTSAHTDLNNVGLLQYCGGTLSIIMMYMSRLILRFQPTACTQHVWQRPHACQHKQFYRCNRDSDDGENMHIRTEIKKSLRWNFY